MQINFSSAESENSLFFPSKLGMVDFFTDEINTYLVGNNESIACTGTHQTLHTNVKDR